MGGAAALRAARQDHRFDAVIDLDGYPRGPLTPDLGQPALAPTQAITPDTDPRYLPQLTEVVTRGTATNYRLTIPGAAHLTFMDGPLYLPPVPALVGSLGRAEGQRVVAAATLAFLDSFLRGGSSDLAGLCPPTASSACSTWATVADRLRPGTPPDSADEAFAVGVHPRCLRRILTACSSRTRKPTPISAPYLLSRSRSRKHSDCVSIARSRFLAG